MNFPLTLAVGQNQYHFGVGEFTTHFRTYFSGHWDVHWGYGLLTHGHLSKGQLVLTSFSYMTCQRHTHTPSRKSLLCASPEDSPTKSYSRVTSFVGALFNDDFFVVCEATRTDEAFVHYSCCFPKS